MNEELSSKTANTAPTQIEKPWLWKKGSPSPNPSGRPKSLWSYIAKRTNNGEEIVNTVYNILKKSKSDKCKLEAARILFHVGGHLALKSADGFEMGENTNIQLIFNFFKLIESLGKDEQFRDRLAKTLESTEALQIRESLQDPNQESEIRESETE